MTSGSDLYEMNCPVPCINEGSCEDDEEEDEVMYEDLLDSNDLVTSQLASSGPVGLAAAAAIASGKKRRRLHSFETNPSIRKRQQTRLLRKLCSLMEEYIVRVGQQAVIVCCSPAKINQGGSFRVYGSQPLEGIIKGRKSNIVTDLEKFMSQQPIVNDSSSSDLFELPPLCVEGVPTSLEKMTQAQLRYFIPEMLKYATGKSKPGWGKPDCRPTWWPRDVPWANVRSDVRDEEAKKETSWTLALRKIVRSCYKHHKREDMLESSNQTQSPTSGRQQQTSCSSMRYHDAAFFKNSIEMKNDHSKIVVQQVTAPDGSIKIVQLDTSGVAIIKDNKSMMMTLQQTSPNVPLNKLPEMMTIKREFEDESQSAISSDTHGNSRKIIHLSYKRTCPFEVSKNSMASLSASMQSGHIISAQLSLPRLANISLVNAEAPHSSGVLH